MSTGQNEINTSSNKAICPLPRSPLLCADPYKPHETLITRANEFPSLFLFILFFFWYSELFLKYYIISTMCYYTPRNEYTKFCRIYIYIYNIITIGTRRKKNHPGIPIAVVLLLHYYIILYCYYCIRTICIYI